MPFEGISRVHTTHLAFQIVLSYCLLHNLSHDTSNFRCALINEMPATYTLLFLLLLWECSLAIKCLILVRKEQSITYLSSVNFHHHSPTSPWTSGEWRHLTMYFGEASCGVSFNLVNSILCDAKIPTYEAQHFLNSTVSNKFTCMIKLRQLKKSV